MKRKLLYIVSFVILVSVPQCAFSQHTDNDDDYEVYLKDNFTGNVFDFRSCHGYEFSSEIGTFNNKFWLLICWAKLFKNLQM